MDQAAYRLGIDSLLKLQRSFDVRKRPTRDKVTVLVNQLVKRSGMTGDPRERYFRLLTTSALLNREPMYSNWDRTKLKKGVKHAKTIPVGNGRDTRRSAQDRRARRRSG